MDIRHSDILMHAYECGFINQSDPDSDPFKETYYLFREDTGICVLSFYPKQVHFIPSAELTPDILITHPEFYGSMGSYDIIKDVISNIGKFIKKKPAQGQRAEKQERI